MDSGRLTASGRQDEQKPQRVALAASLPFDTPPEGWFDKLISKAAELLDAPIAFINIFPWRRPCFKGPLVAALSEQSMEQMMGVHRLAEGRGLVIADLSKDGRTEGLSCVNEDPNIRFYAGIPIKVKGRVCGTLAVMDRKPRPDGPCLLQSAALSGLSACASRMLEDPSVGRPRRP